MREVVRDAYSEPAYRQGDFVTILKDTRPGVSYKASYNKEGRVTVREGIERYNVF